MRMTVTPQAAGWYRHELGLNPGSAIRFFVRYGGESNHTVGFSLGISKETPHHVIAMAEQLGITFFVTDEDAWFFDDADFLVDYDPVDNDIDFHFERSGDRLN